MNELSDDFVIIPQLLIIDVIINLIPTNQGFMTLAMVNCKYSSFNQILGWGFLNIDYHPFLVSFSFNKRICYFIYYIK